MSAAYFSKSAAGLGGVALGFVIVFGSHQMGGRIDRSIDQSVGNPTPAKAKFVTVSVSEFYLVSVSKFYLVSAPDILYGRLCDFYMILNCVGTQNSIMRLRRMRVCQ